MSAMPNDVGQFLKAEREKRAISLDVVHETTKIPLDSLRAIEEGYKIRTLSSFYYKSFVKIYAQYLGQDVNAVLAMIPTTHPDLKPVAARPAAAPVSARTTRELNLFARHVDNSQVKKVVMMVVVALVGLIIFSFVVIAIRKAIRGSGAVVTAPAVKKAVKKSASVKAEPVKATSKKDEAKAVPAAQPAAKAEQEPAAPQKAVKKISLTVQAQSTAWLVVKSDGRTVFQGSLKKGNAETWTGEKKIELAGKGIDQLLYEANGKMLGKISRMNAKIRKVIVTPDGLTVEK